MQKATSTISLSNPVKRRYVAQLDSQPAVKVIVTESYSEEDQPPLDKPRKPRKTDLAKCVKDPERVESSMVANHVSPVSPQQMIYLGGSETQGLDLSIRGGQEMEEQEGSYSLGRWSEEEGGSTDPVYYVQCPECNKKLKQKSYRSHVRTHTGVKQFKCDLCDDRFTRRNDVMRHKRLIHEKPRDFQCEQCQKYFVSQENLALHVEKHKTEMKCRVCDHGFGKREYYENHIKYVHPDGGHPMTTENPDEAPCFAENNHEVNGKPDGNPVILRKSDPQKLIQKDLKIIYLGESEVQQKAEIKRLSPPNSPTEAVAVPAPPTPIILDSYTAINKRDDSIQIVDDSGNVGQILKISDGQFMIVDCKDNPPVEAKDMSSTESPVRLPSAWRTHMILF